MRYQLTAKEKRTLSSCEETIDKGLSSFIDVARALLVIREEGLYKAGFKDFETYCRKRWNMGRNYANKLISSMEAATDVAEVPTKLGTMVPKTEREARELAKVESESQRADVWVKAVETAPLDKQTGQPRLTASHISKTVKEVVGDNGKPKKKPVVAKVRKPKTDDPAKHLHSLLTQHAKEINLRMDDYQQMKPNKRAHAKVVEGIQMVIVALRAWKP